MRDFILLEDNELNEIFETVNEAEVFFHPKKAVAGRLNYKDLLNDKDKYVIFDRNIISYLIEYTKNGILRDDYSMIIIALIMLFCSINNFQISVGFSLQEYSDTQTDKRKIEDELNRFLTITDNYPSMIWKNVLYSENKQIPKLLKVDNYNRNMDFINKGEHQLMHECEMLALVRIYKSDKSKKEKIIEFIEWNYANTLICQYTIVYAILLLGEDKEVRAPKNVNSKDFDKVINGCNNQAWDLTYLSTWSTLYWNEDKTNSIHFFVTNDNLLKHIFNITHAGINIVNELFSKKDSMEINAKMEYLKNNRIRPNIEKDTLEKLLNEEKEKLKLLI